MKIRYKSINKAIELWRGKEMKCLISCSLLFFMLITFCSCGNNNVAECIDLIDNIGEIQTSGFVSPKGEIIYIDTGLIAYETAQAKYEELSDKEKLQVNNANILDDKKLDYATAKELQSKLEAESNIVSECKDAFTNKFKTSLKSPSSYEEVDYSVLVSNELLDMGTGKVFVTLSYSATNSYGGRLQDEISGTVSGTYVDGVFSIENISIPGLIVSMF